MERQRPRDGGSSSGPHGAQGSLGHKRSGGTVLPQEALKAVVKDTFGQAEESGIQYAEVGATIVDSFEEYRRGQDRLMDDLAHRRAKTGGKTGSFTEKNPVVIRTGIVAVLVVMLEVGGLVLDDGQLGALEHLIDALMVLGPVVVAAIGAPLAQQKTTPVGSNPRNN